MIASIVWDVDPILFKVGSWEVRWYGLMWGLGFILAYASSWPCPGFDLDTPPEARLYAPQSVKWIG